VNFFCIVVMLFHPRLLYLSVIWLKDEGTTKIKTIKIEIK